MFTFICKVNWPKTIKISKLQACFFASLTENEACIELFNTSQRKKSYPTYWSVSVSVLTKAKSTTL